ncbi:hypothetical protein ANO11243_091350 [Dothideomycetidae sp. 11243]|nr:hypothetical protein ANO11243_091350 [fungal sp. No.11243]
MVFLVDHRESVDIMLRRTKEFDRSNIFADNFRGNMPNSHVVMPTKDPRFAAQRKLIAATMSRDFLVNVAAKHILKQSFHLINLWRKKSETASNYPFHAADDLQQLAFDSIWAITFGTEANTFEAQQDSLQQKSTIGVDSSDTGQTVEFASADAPACYKAVETLMHETEAAEDDIWPALSYWLRCQSRSWKRAKAYQVKVVEEGLAKSRDRLTELLSGDELTDCVSDVMVLHEFGTAVKEDRPPQYSSAAMKDELLLFVVAGHETTASTLMWAVKYMADHSQVQHDLRSALHHVYPNGELPSGDVLARSSIPYLDATVEEILRLGRPIPGQIRTALCDTQILGHAIPKGTEVFLMSNGPGYVQPSQFTTKIREHDRSKSSQLNKDRAVPDWHATDITTFKPERWLKEDAEGNVIFNPNAGPNSQFGVGERSCFGRKL